MCNRGKNLAKVGDHPPSNPLLTVDLAQNGPTQISDSQFHSNFCFHEGSQIINFNYHLHDLGIFALVFLFYWNSLSFVRGCSDGIQHINEGNKYKSNCCKNDNYNQLFHCQKVPGQNVDHCEMASSILRLSSNKNEEDGDSSVVRAPDSWLKGRGFESLLERWENFLFQGRLSVLTLISVSVPPPCYHSST